MDRPVQKWKEEHFVENMRATITLFAHEENVLTSEALLLLLDLHKKVRGVKFEGRDYRVVNLVEDIILLTLK